MVIEYVALPNTYMLTHQDEKWILTHRDDEPFKFARGLLKRRFENYTERFSTLDSVAAGCKELVKMNPWAFDGNRYLIPKVAQEFLSSVDQVPTIQ